MISLRTYPIDDEIERAEDNLADAKVFNHLEDIAEYSSALNNLKALKEPNSKRQELIFKLNRVGSLLKEISEYSENGFSIKGLFTFQVLNEENCKDLVEGMNAVEWSTENLIYP